MAGMPQYLTVDLGRDYDLTDVTFLPRQDGGTNGNIREYTVQVSDDGKTWSKPVAAGSFGRGTGEQRVELERPVKARYIRFTALSSQNGADFAGGAEFSVIAD